MTFDMVPWPCARAMGIGRSEGRGVADAKVRYSLAQALEPPRGSWKAQATTQ